MTEPIPEVPALKASEDFTLRLRPLPNWRFPPEQRLRAALKRLLRDYGFASRRVSASPYETKGGTATMKTKPELEILTVRSEALERVLTELNAEGRKILSAKVAGEEKYELVLAQPNPNRKKLRHPTPG